MTYVITKEFAFSASHQLEGLREGHPCGRLHGHNYRVRVELAHTDLNADGFVRDYGDLDWFKAWIDQQLDHRHLNDVCRDQVGDGFQTSAENLAAFLFDVVRSKMPLETRAVGVSETPKTWAWYRPERIETTALGDSERTFITRDRGAEHERSTPEVE